ncbi:MAG: fibronectin type III domain-containing protein [Nitrospiraceae bacterium]
MEKEHTVSKADMSAPWLTENAMELMTVHPASHTLRANPCTHSRVIAVLCLLITLCLMSSACGPSTDDNTPGTANDLTPPSAPANLTNAAASSTMVDLNWDASTDDVGVTEYWIYRCIGTNCSPTRYQFGITETTFSETGLAPNTRYRYAVSALDAAGNQSPLSAIYELTTPPLRDTKRPTPPSDLTAATVSSTQIDIRWTVATDDSGVIASYSVYRCQGACSPSNSVARGVKTTMFSDKTTSPSTPYTYAVTAFDAAGNESLPSSTISATTPNPPDTISPTAPTGLNVTPISATQINLSWQASTDNIEVEDYSIHRCTGVGCTNPVQIDTVPSETLAYQNTGLIPSTTYTYSVRARDQAGNIGPPSTTISAKTFAAPDTSAPSVPTALSATAQSSSRISLSWAASSDNVGVMKYSIYRCTGSGCTPTTKLVDITAPTTSFSNSGLAASTTYTYAVTASDAAKNESGKSPRASATTQAAPAAQTYTLIGAGDIAWPANI